MHALGYLTDQDLALAIRHAELERALERERASEYAHTLSGAWATSGLDYYRDYLVHLRAVELADVARFASRYLDGQPLVIGVMLSPATRRQRRWSVAHFRALLGSRP